MKKVLSLLFCVCFICNVVRYLFVDLRLGRTGKTFSFSLAVFVHAEEVFGAGIVVGTPNR